MIAAMPLPGGAEMPRRVLSLDLPRLSKEILMQLHCWKLQRRRVDPSVATLARLVQASERTVQRHLRELSEAGFVLRAYNGGRAKRCLYYVGKSAAQALSQEAPAWDEKCHFGPLRLGRRALAKATTYPDKIVTLKPDHSSSVERSDRDQRPGEPPRSESSGAASQPGEAARPPTPLAGGAANVEQGPIRPPTGSPIHVPPNPPRGAQGSRGTKQVGGRGARAWQTDPAFWRQVWGVYDAFHRAICRGPRVPDIRDAVAMSGLIREALFAARQSEPEALRYLAWGFRQHFRERRGEPLWRLRRVRSEYGWPKSGWKVPSPEDFENWIAKRRQPVQSTENIAPACNSTTNAAGARALLDKLKPR